MMWHINNKASGACLGVYQGRKAIDAYLELLIDADDYDHHATYTIPADLEVIELEDWIDTDDGMMPCECEIPGDRP